MLGFTRLSEWYRNSSSSVGVELESRIKKAEEEIRAEWAALVARVEELERRLTPSMDNVPPPPPKPAEKGPSPTDS